MGLLDLLFPPRCGGCLRPGSWFCSRCRDGVTPLSQPLCGRCGRELASAGDRCSCRELLRHLVGVRAHAMYEGPLERAIHRFKYSGWRCLAPTLAELLLDVLAVNPPPAALVVPVPLHPHRRHDRGYNQSALLARQVSKRMHVALDERRLKRTRATPPQVGQDRRHRFQNVEGAFKWAGKDLAGQPVLLVDDVITTGATLEACARALRTAGAGPITGLTLARVGL